MAKSPRLRVGASGVVQSNTGIGVIQRRLYPKLEARGVELHLSSNRDLGSGIRNKVVGMVRGFIPARGGAAYLSVVPPFPVGVRVPSVTVIHDLRWQTTRSGLGRRYRAWDLRRTVRRSDHLLCISERTQTDLVAFDPRAASKSSVVWWGPGLMEGVDFDAAKASTEQGRALLIGGAPHKRNELAAELIASLPRTMIDQVSCVGVSAATTDVLRAALGDDRVDIHGRISDEEMVRLFSQAEYFVLLGTDEGFGLPFIEALAAGCVVIAQDQPLTRELMDGAAVLISGSSVEELAQSVTSAVVPAEESRRAAARKFDWDKVADQMVGSLSSSHAG